MSCSKNVLCMLMMSGIVLINSSMVFWEQIEILAVGEKTIHQSIETNQIDKNDAQYLFDRIATNHQLTEDKKSLFVALFNQFAGLDFVKKSIFVKDDILETFLWWAWVFKWWISVSDLESVEKEWVSMTYCSKTAKINLSAMTCLETNSVFSKYSIVQGDAITLIEQWWANWSLIAMPLDTSIIREYLSTIHQIDWSVVFDMYIYRAWFVEKEEGDHYRKGHRAVAFVWEDWEVYVLDPYMSDQKPILLSNYASKWGTEEQIILFPQFWYAYSPCALPEDIAEEQWDEASQEPWESLPEETIQQALWEERKPEENEWVFINDQPIDEKDGEKLDEWVDLNEWVIDEWSQEEIIELTGEYTWTPANTPDHE